jgi:hypothetical protein
MIIIILGDSKPICEHQNISRVLINEFGVIRPGNGKFSALFRRNFVNGTRWLPTRPCPINTEMLRKSFHFSVETANVG